MGSGSESSGRQSSFPGTLSPVTATMLSLFGGQPEVFGGQFRPTSFGAPTVTQGPVIGRDPRGRLIFGPSTSTPPAFTPQSFAALPGLLTNMPLTGTEEAITGGGFQNLGLLAALQSQGLLQQGAEALPALLETDPTAAIAAARRGFTQETIPAVLERAPGFSSSDLQRELARAGVDLETNIAALREANLGRVGQTVQALPAFAQALGSNLLDRAAQVLGFGQLGREFVREVSPAGDAFRTLAALQSLQGSTTQFQTGRQSSKSAGVLA